MLKIEVSVVQKFQTKCYTKSFEPLLPNECTLTNLLVEDFVKGELVSLFQVLLHHTPNTGNRRTHVCQRFVQTSTVTLMKMINLTEQSVLRGFIPRLSSGTAQVSCTLGWLK